MAAVIQGRMTAEVEGDFVVFLIGMRINALWKIWKWRPGLTAMPRMLRRLAANPDIGLLHARNLIGLRSATVIQYWRSFTQFHAYATNRAVDGNPAVGKWQ